MRFPSMVDELETRYMVEVLCVIEFFLKSMLNNWEVYYGMMLYNKT